MISQMQCYIRSVAMTCNKSIQLNQRNSSRYRFKLLVYKIKQTTQIVSKIKVIFSQKHESQISNKIQNRTLLKYITHLIY